MENTVTMSAKRPYHFNHKHSEIALFGRAISHELRLEILSMLLEQKSIRSVDLVRHFQTTKSNIHHHIEILKDAQLVQLFYTPHSYLLSIPKLSTEKVQNLLQ